MRRTEGDSEAMKETVDDRLKQLMQRLGEAINESLAESESISEVIGEIRGEGYDVFLVLEATIGLNKREDDDDSPARGFTTGLADQSSFSEQDHAFLKALKITVEE